MPRVKPYVKLIEHTPNPDKVVALSAKLCYSKSDIDTLSDSISQKEQDDFIAKLMNMSHFSPIEHVSFTFGIEGVSRSLLAQITRHRLASFSVQSQRYVSAKEDFNFIIPPNIEKLGSEAVAQFENQMQTMGKWYKEWQDRLGNLGESSNEDARFVLPNSCETKMVMTMNARELMHFLSLRCCFRAQWEIREVAFQILKICKDVAPTLFKNVGPSCFAGKCKEGEKTCGKSQEVKDYISKL